MRNNVIIINDTLERCMEFIMAYCEAQTYKWMGWEKPDETSG
jgi:hypothetical protein